ncbi:MAG TPA: FG-GAP repeat protein [Chitinophagaceae bacterium]|nr:FG-GAP repeat protein [Chitinophagaceae bacterium]
MKKIFITCLFVAASTIAICQNIGVGTSNPTEKLEVNGNVKANGIKILPNAGSGKVLTSDANGNGTWQNMANNNNGDVGYGPWGDCSMNGVTDYLPVADPAGNEYEYMGNAVAVFGNFAVIGKHRKDMYGNDGQGAADVYEHNGTTWVFKQTLFDPTGLAGDYFGASVSISANYIAVGADGAKIAGIDNWGAVYIYKYVGGSWTFQQKITDPTGAADDYFGRSVSITETILAVGIPNDDIGVQYQRGSVCMFRNNGAAWVSQAKLVDPDGYYGEYFGNSVSVFDNRVVIGAPFDNVAAGDYEEGSASIFEFNGTSWLFKQRINGMTGTSGAEFKFGYSVSMWGDWILVGVPNQDVYSQWQEQGAAWFFRYNGTSWVYTKSVFNLKEQPADEFGTSVCISGDYAIVGTRWDDVKYYQGGSATIYKKVGIGWGEVQYLSDKMGDSWSEFGNAVSIDGNTRRFIVAAHGYANGAGKVVFGKVY